jgi:hypothetical protein
MPSFRLEIDGNLQWRMSVPANRVGCIVLPLIALSPLVGGWMVVEGLAGIVDG